MVIYMYNKNNKYGLHVLTPFLHFVQVFPLSAYAKRGNLLNYNVSSPPFFATAEKGVRGDEYVKQNI